VVNIRDKVEDVSNNIDKLIRDQYDQQKQAILDWLTPVDYFDQQNDFIRTQQPGTGHWFLQTPEYRAWLDGDRQTLFCPGIPGAGKTMITAIVIHHLQTKFRNKTIGIAYVYCSFQRQHEQKPGDLLASLLKQLSHSQPSCPPCVQDLYDQHQKDRTRPSLDEISRTLRSVITMYSRVFIAVDALDECKDTSRNITLTEIFNIQAKTSLNIIATSRINDAIQKRFDGYQSLKIHAADDDIRRYIASQITSLEKDLLDDDIREEIQSKIAEAAEGMYVLHEV
jgi:Cdc6-like AAA superfamily ATPase